MDEYMNEDLTLEQKVGALFSMSFEGVSIDSETRRHFAACHIANYILFAENLGDYKSTANLTISLQQIARDVSGIPAFISTDQEGGMVERLHSGATHFPSNMAISAAGYNNQTKIIGRMVGKELRALGINLNHAPCVDINNNPLNPVIGIRSYSDDPKIVAMSGCGYIQGLQESGCIAQAKHFPGHGNTHIDSHLSLPTIDSSLEELEEMELIPFRQAIEVGVDSMMTAHILFPKLEPDNLPATMSKRILTGLLRERLGFDGLIMTDSMSMNAIKEYYGMERGCVAAIAAGADVVCMRADFDDQRRAYSAVLEAVKSGELPMGRVDDAITRQVRLKTKYAIGFNNENIDALVERYPEHEAFADEISAKSITLFRDQERLLPITNRRLIAISPPPVSVNIADDQFDPPMSFAEYLARETGGDFEIIPYEPDAADISRVINRADGHGVIVQGAYNAAFSKGQQQLASELVKLDIPLIIVALRAPYDIAYMPKSASALLTYEYTNKSVQNVTMVLRGQKAYGRIPVSALYQQPR